MKDSLALRAVDATHRELEAEYIAANPKSAASFVAAKDPVSPGEQIALPFSIRPFPDLVDAEAATVETADGQRLTDLLGNFTAGLFGFSPEPVQEAVRDAMTHGHALGGGPNLHEAEVARRLTERFPSMELIRFTMTGTEANTYAINTALAVTGRGKILVYDGAYHGAWIHGGVAAGPLDTPYAKLTVSTGTPISSCVPSRKTPRTSQHLFSNLSWLISSTYLKRVAPAAYLRRIREACSAAGCALIFDEVMTSRLAPGGAQMLVGITPDMTTLGKYFGGGLPLAPSEDPGHGWSVMTHCTRRPSIAAALLIRMLCLWLRRRRSLMICGPQPSASLTTRGVMPFASRSISWHGSTGLRFRHAAREASSP